MQSVQSTRGQEVLPPLIISRVCLEGKEPCNAHCCSAFVFVSFHINSFAKFASLLTLDPIRCREHEALNSMNTNIFPRRPKEVLDDSINAFSSNFVIFFLPLNQIPHPRGCWMFFLKESHAHLLCRLFFFCFLTFRHIQTTAHHCLMLLTSAQTHTHTHSEPSAPEPHMDGIKLGLKIQAWCLT